MSANQVYQSDTDFSKVESVATWKKAHFSRLKLDHVDNLIGPVVGTDELLIHRPGGLPLEKVEVSSIASILSSSCLKAPNGTDMLCAENSGLVSNTTNTNHTMDITNTSLGYDVISQTSKNGTRNLEVISSDIGGSIFTDLTFDMNHKTGTVQSEIILKTQADILGNISQSNVEITSNKVDLNSTNATGDEGELIVTSLLITEKCENGSNESTRELDNARIEDTVTDGTATTFNRITKDGLRTRHTDGTSTIEQFIGGAGPQTLCSTASGIGNYDFFTSGVDLSHIDTGVFKSSSLISSGAVSRIQNTDAGTGDYSKLEVTDVSSSLISETIGSNITTFSVTPTSIIDNRGHETHVDSSSIYPLVVNNARILLQNDSSATPVMKDERVIVNGSPVNLWDTATNTVIPVREGDSMTFSISFICIPSVNNTKLVLELDVGAPTLLVENFKAVLRNAGLPTPVNMSFTVPVGPAFKANGGQFYINTISTGSNVTINNFNLFVERSYGSKT